ncbi:MAG: DUF3108 domain-containing protein [Candidatus Omnitrophica bacterium]|nr:DUF3108 domain-containing protein [Candidatus Omnitrophota bacterium]
MDHMGISKNDRVALYRVLGWCVLLALISAGCAASKAAVVKGSVVAADRKILAKDIAIEKAAAPFRVGEELTYEVAWLGIPVATVVARVKGIERLEGREAYVVELTARTNAFCSKIYPVDDTYLSYIDKERYVSLKHVVRRREGRYKKDAVTVFDYNAKKAYFHNLCDGSRKTFDIPGDVQDSLSAAYYFRTVDAYVGQKVGYTVVNNEEVYNLFGLIEKKAFIKLDNVTYETFYVEPYAVLKGERVKKGNASCYFSCDNLRIPVYGMVKAPLFTKITAVLVNKKEGASDG